MVFLGGVLRHASVTPKQLYKRLLRDCEKLPKEAQNHYKHAVKQVLTSITIVVSVLSHLSVMTFCWSHCTLLQSFLQHVDEPDPQRVKDIIDKALKDAEWVLAKVSLLSLTHSYHGRRAPFSHAHTLSA